MGSTAPSSYYIFDMTIPLFLQQNALTVGTAESCTGGSIAATLTAVSGSSAYVKGGIVAYSNDVKTNVLGVSAEDILRYGAVSEQVVHQMARGAQRILACDCAVATSGVAGPTGGTPDKPVGTVWIAAAYGEQIRTQCFHFEGTRSENVQASTETALRMLLDLLSNSF